MKCSNCEAEISPDDAFCTKCGTKVVQSDGTMEADEAPAEVEGSVMLEADAANDAATDGAAKDGSDDVLVSDGLLDDAADGDAALDGKADDASQEGEGSSVGSQEGKENAEPSRKRVGLIAGITAAVVVVACCAFVGVGFATEWFGTAKAYEVEGFLPAVTAPGAALGYIADALVEVEDEAIAAKEEAERAAAEAARIKSSVDEYSWAELAEVAQDIAQSGSPSAAIEVAKKFNLCAPDGTLTGSEVKNFTLADGTPAQAHIIGFYHDNVTGGGKAGISFITRNCVALHAYNANGKTTGGWQSSDVRSWLNSSMLAALPDDMRGAIKAVDKVSDGTGQGESLSDLVTTSDRLWLLSVIECGGNEPSSVYVQKKSTETKIKVMAAEGTRYQLYRNVSGSSVLAKKYDGADCQWWLRTCDMNVTACRAFAMNADGKGGHVSDYVERDSNGIAFGFGV